MEGLINEDVESNNEDDEIYELCGNETNELPVCTVRRFEMIKYSFGQDEEYVAVKEDEYEDLMSTRKVACQEYQEIFFMMDEGWMDVVAKKSTKLVKYQSSGILCVIVVMLEYSWSFVKREGNRVAHSIASLVLSCSYEITLDGSVPNCANV
ncbi:hypothetical protein Tco_1344060 [Tanacetum coccineum]